MDEIEDVQFIFEARSCFSLEETDLIFQKCWATWKIERYCIVINVKTYLINWLIYIFWGIQIQN